MRAILLCLALVAGPSPGVEQQSSVITLSPAETSACAAGGGCMLITAEQVHNLKMIVEGHRMCLYTS